ncbi:MAG: AI-2E family transporter [Oscillospiraceae bacterium]|nr:AI-2E family transporter [Oscillospiraceae bacterium]
MFFFGLEMKRKGMVTGMDIVEKRKATLISLVYYAFIIAAYYLFLKYAFWLVAPFVFAFLIAMILQRPVRAISKKTHIKKGIVAAVAVLLILAVIISLIVLVGYRVTVEFKGLGQYIMEKFNDLPNLIKSCENWILEKIRFLPDSIEKTVADAVSGTIDKLLVVTQEESAELGAQAQRPSSGGFDFSVLATPLGGLLSSAKQIPGILTAILISIIACFFITCDYDGVTNMIKKNVSEEHEIALVRTKRLLGDIMGKMCKSYVTIIFITFCEISIGLNILKLIGVYNSGYIVAISMCTAIVDIMPVLGTGTIMIPWALISFFTGNTGLGIGLAVMYALITVIRQILEPRLVAMNVGLPPIMTLAGMYIGLQLFGVIGIFILPITFVLVKALNDEEIIHLWGRDRHKKAAEETQPAAKQP